MLQIRCTKKLLDDLGIDASALAEIKQADSLLGNWYANALRIGREKCVLVMNEKTLYSFILPWSFRNDAGKFARAFIDSLRPALETEWIESNDIARVMSEYDKIEFTATDSKRLLGSLNDLAQQYDYYVAEAGGVKSSHLAKAVGKVNQTPQRTLGWLHSNEALERLFKDKNRQGDEPPRNEPEDHAVITKILKKIGSGHTLHELYGLFYGCAAATHPVPPSGHLPIIFDPETAKFESEQDAKTLLEKMLTLWNMIATWDPQGTDFFFPPTKYPVTVHGVLTRSGDLVSFVHYFIKGLDVGRTEEGDFSEDASAALQDLAELTQNMEQYIEQLEKVDAVAPKILREGMELIERMEHISADCIGRVHKGLRNARLNAASRPVVSEGGKTGGNELCPCGSGRKFKRCCGLTH